MKSTYNRIQLKLKNINNYIFKIPKTQTLPKKQNKKQTIVEIAKYL